MKATSIFEAIIESPRGSMNKYSFDTKSRQFYFNKTLPHGFTFPQNFGFIPDTKADDGDPIDILVMTDEPLVMNCIVKCRILGALTVKQTKDGEKFRNDILIGVPDSSDFYKNLHTIEDVNKNMIDEFIFFFTAYHEEIGSKFKATKILSVRAAVKLIKDAS
jgi:inorganic pyrophosphatase